MQRHILSQSYKINYNNQGFNKGVNNHNIKRQKVGTEIKSIKKNTNMKNPGFPPINPILPKNPNKKRIASCSMDNKIEKNIRINKIDSTTPNNDNKIINMKHQQSPNKNRQEQNRNINNLIVNSLDNWRLPEGLDDITFDCLKKE